MQIILLMIVLLLVFLFLLFSLSNDDFILLRKNVNTEQVFNLAFTVLLLGLFSSRLFYALLNQKISFLSPIVFLSFPYFPGFSVTGGILGAIFSLLFFSKRNKFPFNRLFDIFSIAFSGSYSFYFLIKNIENAISKKILIPQVIIFIISILFLSFLLKFFLKGKVKEGIGGFYVLVFFSIVSLVQSLLPNPKINLLLTNQNYLSIGVLIVSIIFIINKNFLTKLVKGKK